MDKKYTLETNAINYELVFEGDKLYCSMIRKIAECNVNQITKVVLKKPALSGGDEISFQISYTENNKEKKFLWIQTKITSNATTQFFEDLKSHISENAQWIDLREVKNVDKQGRTMYDLQYLPLGYAGSGLPRSLQIWIYLICLGVLVVPLVYYIYLLATGGYRIYTNENGMEIKKTLSNILTWANVDKFLFTEVDVFDSNSFSSTKVLKIEILSKLGNKSSVIMRYDYAIPFMKELVKRNLLSEQSIAKYI